MENIAQRALGASFFLILTLTLLFLLNGGASHSIIVGGALALFFGGLATGRVRLKDVWNGGAPSLSWFFAFLLAYFLANGKTLELSSYDNFATNLETIGILGQGSTELSPFFSPSEKLPYAVKETASGLRSRFPRGMLVFSLPVYAVARALGADLLLRQWRLAKLAGSLISALSVVLFFVVAAKLAGGSAALWVTLFLGVGSSFTTLLSQGLWSHTGVVFWECVILYLDVMTTGRWKFFLQGLCGSLMLATRLTSLSFLVPWCLFQAYRNKKGAFQLIVTLAFGFLPWALWYKSQYGLFTGPESLAVDFIFTWHQFRDGFFGLLISPARGFFIYQPWAFLALLWFVPSVRKKFRSFGNLHSSQIAMLALFQFSLHLVAMSFWYDWPGGYCFGPRVLAETLPLVGLTTLFPVVALLKHEKWLATFACLGALIHATALFGKAVHWYDSHYSTDVEVWHQNQWLWLENPIIQMRRSEGK